MTTSRRDLLKGTLATAAVAAIPFAAIAGLTPVVTLGQLAAEGKYASSDLQLPADMHDRALEWQFRLDGELIGEGVFVKEIYAPGDDTGWCVLYCKEKNDRYTGETELVRGRWTIRRVPVAV